MRALVFVQRDAKPRGAPAFVIDERAVADSVCDLELRGFHVAVHWDCATEGVRCHVISALRGLKPLELLVVAWVGCAIDNGNGDVRLLPHDSDVDAGEHW